MNKSFFHFKFLTKPKIYVGGIAIVFILVFFMFWNSFYPSDKVDFSSDIKPIFNSKCIACHGGVKKNGGFSLLFEEEAFGNTDSGNPAIIPGDATGSELIRRLHEEDPELRMPYEKPKLSDREIDLLTRWIDQGAEWGEHWAYTLPEKVDIPSIAQEAGFMPEIPSGFVQNSIDNFVAARLEGEELQLSEAADKKTLARRAALDITGLPPDDSLFQSYLNEGMTYESFVDSLLAKKAYGEKWASWWLDLARYADTKGLQMDAGRTMWEYRDWVIRAFNKNMPFDQFTIEQLAGDLLPEPSVDQLIATAFHRNTMNNDEGGTEDEEFRTLAVMDRISTTFDVWQSTTMACVQCHSHPYDPIRHDAYYNVFAFFNNTRDEDTTYDEPNMSFYTPKQQHTITMIMDWIKKYGDTITVKEYKDFLTFKEPVYHAHLGENFENGELIDTRFLGLRDNGSCNVNNIYTKGAESMLIYYSANFDGSEITIRRDDSNGEILAQFTMNKTKGRIIRKIPFKKIDGKANLYFEAKNTGISPQAYTGTIVWFGFLNNIPGRDVEGYANIENAFLDILNTETPTLPIMVENPEHMRRTTQVFERGNWMMKTDTVKPGIPQILNPWEDEFTPDRLGLAKWIVSEKNPLTARTLVNRVWHQIFGRGIVASIEDMGTQSDPPSHPALLDWLSLRFMHDHNWNIKALIKDIITSGTYRQCSENRPSNYGIDPDNTLLARGPRMRLSAEQIYDQALAVSGLLSNKMFGPGVMPPQPPNIWQSVYNSEQWIESKGEDRHRRAVYTYLKRTSPYPSYITFDAVSREVSSVRRTVTNTPLQALVTLNDPVYLEASYNLAKYMDYENIEQGIAYGYSKIMFKDITPSRLDTLKKLYMTSLKEFQQNEEAVRNLLIYNDRDATAKMAALTIVANTMMNLDEFLTKS
jgi:hypothetical protein